MSREADVNAGGADAGGAGVPRQRIERVAGSRRAKLTPAPGTTAEPVPADEADDADAGTPAAAQPPTSGPNDDRLRRDVPPHY